MEYETRKNRIPVNPRFAGYMEYVADDEHEHPSDANTDGVSDKDIESWDSTDASEHPSPSDGTMAQWVIKIPKPKKPEWLKKDQDNKPSCDKGSHKERSKANQPNHEKHWKKVEKNKPNGG